MEGKWYGGEVVWRRSGMEDKWYGGEVVWRGSGMDVKEKVISDVSPHHLLTSQGRMFQSL